MTAPMGVPRESHSFMWWAYDRAWANLQRENYARYSLRQPLLTTIEPRHYEFIKDCKPVEGHT